MKRYVFILSDGTGITAENLGNSLMTQFEHTEFEKNTIPYLDSTEKAYEVLKKINQIYEEWNTKPLIFMTLVNPQIREIIKSANARVFDLFSTFIGPLEEELQEKSSYTVGRYHGVANLKSYNHRIEAVDFALAHDDGLKTRGYDKADLILIGVSRCGKTPTCIYLALQYGIYAANYPFTEEDLLHQGLPEALKPYKNKLFGLTIDYKRLEQIRTERIPNSQYASADQCRAEVHEVAALYRKEHIPFINTTKYSIEEIATRILAATGIQRRL